MLGNFEKSGIESFPRTLSMRGGVNFLVFRNFSIEVEFVKFAPRLNCFRKEGMAVLAKAGSYPMEDGRRVKVSREPPLSREAWCGRAMSKAEMVWADWKFGKRWEIGYRVEHFACITS